MSALSFNSGGNLLLAMAADCDHTISIFDWRAQTKLVEGKGHGSAVDSIKFNPYSASAFASCGEKHREPPPAPHASTRTRAAPWRGGSPQRIQTNGV